MEKNTPTRMSIVDLSRPASKENVLTAQFNPTELEEALSVNWNKLPVLGLSHMPLQYQQTDNHGFSFELAFRALDDTGNKLDSIAHARRFLLSLCYSQRGTNQSLATGAPPRVLFYWPQLAALTCVIRKLSIKHTQFNRLGAPVVTAVKVTIEEIRDFRLYAGDVLADGTIRSTGL